MVTMSDYTTEQLKEIVSLGVDYFKEILEERLESENKLSFPIQVGDCFFDEECSVFQIIKLIDNKIYYQVVTLCERSINLHNSYIEKECHNFDNLKKVESAFYDKAYNLVSNYLRQHTKLKYSTLKQWQEYSK